MKVDCAVVGGGIVGLSVAMSLLQRQPGVKILLLEKESALGQHQSGRNSGVIHSGIYYKPGSLKARLAREGNDSMVQFCRRHGIAHEVCGKVIVATKEAELPSLKALQQRGLENGLEVAWMSPQEVAKIEPHVRCLAGLRVPSTGIADYREVVAKYAALVEAGGGVIKKSAALLRFRNLSGSQVLETSLGEFESRFVINCGGLYSDRIARSAGVELKARIIPFRGEYYELAPEKRHLVKALVYPVPDPTFPFLGVHFTRAVDDSVHAGPNAVLALSREGYRKSDVAWRDLAETFAFPGFWKIARRHRREGWMEIRRSLSKKAFVRSLQNLIPEVTESDLVPAPAGVRAQAVLRDGSLVDDFLVVRQENSIHVCNAPSPAATASLEIGRMVAAQVPELRHATSRPMTKPAILSSHAV